MPATPADRLVTAVAVLLVASLAGVLLGVSPAAAHAVLTGTQPERGATVTEPLDVVALEFSEGVAFPQVQITGPDGERVEEGLPAELGESVEQPLPAVLEQGTYTVAFRVTSDDGHPVEGDFTFTYSGPVGVGGEGDPPPATTDPPGDDPEATPDIREDQEGIETAQDPGAEEEVSLSAPVLWIALVVLLGIAAAAAFAVRRRRGNGSSPGDPGADRGA